MLAGTFLLLAACGRGDKFDVAVADRLLNTVDRKAPPKFHGEELTRLSAELPRYRRFIDEQLGFGKEFHLRAGLADAYVRWRYDDEALFLYREGLAKGDPLGPWGWREFVFEAAVARDVSMLEKGWKSLAAEKDVVVGVSRAALESLARGDIESGLVQALHDLEMQEYIRERAIHRTFVARVLAKEARNPKLRALEQRAFDAQLREFLLGGDWSDFVARYVEDRHNVFQTVLIEELASTMGYAAEYYAKWGDEAKKAEWLKRMAELREAMHKKKGFYSAAWLDHLAQRVKSTAASR